MRFPVWRRGADRDLSWLSSVVRGIVSGIVGSVARVASLVAEWLAEVRAGAAPFFWRLLPPVFLLVLAARLIAVGPTALGQIGAAQQIFLPSVAAGAPALTATYDWLQYNGDSAHSGNNTLESRISANNVASLSQVFRASLPDVADGAPVYLRGVATVTGTHDLLFATTRSGDIVALDAHTGAQIWDKQHPADGCLINGGPSVCYTTSSPAIDPNRRFVYSYGLDGRAHKHQVGDGTEVTSGGWPELATLKGGSEKGSSALTIATTRGGTTYLYVANGGYPGDAGDYQGHVTAINLATGQQGVFNATCSDQPVHFVAGPAVPSCPFVQTAVWNRPGVVYDSATDRLYTATGNGTFDPAKHAWGDSVLAIAPDGTGLLGDPLDTYTPTNYQDLQRTDTDLGSTGPTLLSAPSGSLVAHLAVQGGKDGLLRLLNLDNLGGAGSPAPGKTGGEIGSPVAVPQGGEILTQPATWRDPSDGSEWVFVTTAGGISAHRVGLGADQLPKLTLVWANSASGDGGFSPLVANGVVYYASSGIIRALSPTTGKLLWSSTGIGSIHWESPVVVSGVLYLVDETAHLTAFAPSLP